MQGVVRPGKNHLLRHGRNHGRFRGKCPSNTLIIRGLTGSSPLRSSQKPAESTAIDDAQEPKSHHEKPKGAMSRRLAAMQDESLAEGGRGARKAVEEAGFDPDLKARLLSKIADTNFKSEHAAAFSELSMPTSAGRGTRENAAAPAWTGTESVADTSLRMLDDSIKRLRTPARPTRGLSPPVKVDTGRPNKVPSSGTRLANARDKSSMYTYMQDASMTDKEREQYRKELKERFSPHARAVPSTIQGLASLANERIEDAIARGQFKNLPRGKAQERDYHLSSPFLDTTEYFMNKIIQKQEIVPPWIEKQQELVSTATKFRARLRTEWRRHAARMIAARGGSLESQVQRAEAYAAAEARANPRRQKTETLNAVDTAGHVSQITLSGDLHGVTATAEPVPSASASASAPESEASSPAAEAEKNSPASVITIPTAEPPAPDPPTPISTHPFRDATWEAHELSYHTLAITNLNSLTRSYNLMAPNLAKKPYFSLERELRACYADVAPQLADEIRARSTRAHAASLAAGAEKQKRGVLEMLGAGAAERQTRVWDETRPQYGLKEFWRDLFAKG